MKHLFIAVLLLAGTAFAQEDKLLVILKSDAPGNCWRVCQINDHHATQAAARGIIALQMHPGSPMKIQFKNIRLKELK